jgi:asparagine synthase (glutamine-hydrolysing)
MCGIAGIVSLGERPVAPDEVERMCGALAHRGPDDWGLHAERAAAIGMRRLSIIDLETGRQPVCNEDGGIWTVFNGEIYNYGELRRELLGRGHVFRTRSDTETIVHLYEERGERCVEALRGMFAFAVWDARRRRLLLARDRLGIKPLYYTLVGGRLAFASELKALLELPELPRELDWAAVSHFFTFLSTPPAASILRGVHKLEPGHVLVAERGSAPRARRYWELPFEPDRSRGASALEQELRELLEESVRLHLVSDVPLGAFLSGGVDSSAVVALMTRLGHGTPRTFSIGYADAEFSELPWARLAARELGTRHHELVLDADVADVVEEVVFHLDEPFGDSSAIPTYMVSKLAAQHVKVVLSGDGGDELFAGYDKYRVEARERRLERVPGVLRRALAALASRTPEGTRGRRFLKHMALDGAERYLHASTLFDAEQKARIFRPEALARLAGHDPWWDAARQLRGGARHWLSALQAWDLASYLPLDILTKVDRVSMAHSLEARVPLLDHVLVEFAARIPPELQLANGRGKLLFKRALRGLVPDAILDRRKRGFAIPLGRWLEGPLGRRLRELMLSERTRARGLFDVEALESLLRGREARSPLALPFWTLASFELWCRLYLDRPAPAAQRSTRAARPQAPGMAASLAEAGTP